MTNSRNFYYKVTVFEISNFVRIILWLIKRETEKHTHIKKCLGNTERETTGMVNLRVWEDVFCLYLLFYFYHIALDKKIPRTTLSSNTWHNKLIVMLQIVIWDSKDYNISLRDERYATTKMLKVLFRTFRLYAFIYIEFNLLRTWVSLSMLTLPKNISFRKYCLVVCLYFNLFLENHTNTQNKSLSWGTSLYICN